MDQFDNGRKDPDLNDEAEDHDINKVNLYGSTPVPTDIANNRDEETAQELTADDYNDRAEQRDDSDVGSHVNSAVGWVALILSIASFFFMPIILGGAGIIVGFIAKSRDADTLGNTAIIAGAASIIITLFVLPYL
ncbi:hypothetical protein CFK37_13955 [Virgibacillus phasianinus]|uniref:DUF4190 domain-containing protein n=1 Tax=Virgibacillus phasianinus TaxID=2017483 RepID=A0A220U536_9BACI|nr:DUF4190 domain-containing protein [Virgibacillus phasianinus]ASK63175.1 hypothetical protein CFK37_13955 [Virgibacillus phasianinus]